MHKVVIIVAMILAVSFSRTSPGATWYVDDSVSVSGDGKSWESAFKTIQEGIDIASEGDTVIVAQGTYIENVEFRGKNITVTSANPLDPAIIAKTIIDGNQAESVVTFAGMENETCVLSGFTIRNGRSDHGGGGICGWEAHARIENNIITANVADMGGGLSLCQGIIQNNIIVGNSSGLLGGGLSWCSGAIQNNRIIGNSAILDGGGLSNCDGTIQNNIIVGNSSGFFSGGLSLCDGAIQNNTIYGNSAPEMGGLGWCTGEIRNCIIWGNKANFADQIHWSSQPAYSCIQDWAAGGEGNVWFNPYFVDAANGDFHLRSWSPCIDAGDPASPFFNEPQPNGGRVDMGAYGNTPEATSKSPDTDVDGLPDDWEMEFFGNLAQQPGDDPDEDFRSNVDEYYGGYDPTIQEPTIPTANWYVDCSVAHSGDGKSWQGAFKTIQEGIDAASDGEAVMVARGTYLENIKFDGKNIVLRSVNPLDPSVVAGTIIDGNGQGSVVTFVGNEKSTCVLSGFTVRNGAAENGGGICGGKWNASTRATIQNNIITGNSARTAGGLIWCNGVIQNNIICGNSAEWYGGGLDSCDGTIENDTIYANSAGYYGGISGGRGVIRNCIIWGNRCQEALVFDQINPMIKLTYCCIEEWSGGGEGNISYNPHFVDAANGDFHLRSWSPCVDAGDPASGFRGEPEPNGGRIDMGAYGNTPGATSKSPDADSDGLPDDWEMEFFGNLARGPGDDPDDDLRPNLDEYYRGTTPAAMRFLYVDGSVQVSGDGTSWDKAFKTIQEGIDAASEGAVVVAPGTYLENVRFKGKNITLRSIDPLDAAIVANTIVDGNQAGSVVNFDGTENAACVLSGFTIRNGSAANGGGICGGTWDRATRAPIENNVICGNAVVGRESPAGQGGGVAYCAGIIRNCSIYENSAERAGGGVYYCAGLIQNNEILRNSAEWDGGGLANCDAEISNNAISGNRACGKEPDRGGGGLLDCDGPIHDNKIEGNIAYKGGGLCECDGTIARNEIRGNSATCGGGLYSCRGTVENNSICGNRAIDGAGMHYCQATIRNNVVCGNAGSYGGGIAGCEGVIENNMICDNLAVEGGGVRGFEGVIRNNTICGNWAQEEGGGIYECRGQNTTIENCIIWGNWASQDAQIFYSNRPRFSCIQDWKEDGPGNIVEDPKFVDADGRDDDPRTYQDNDWHLSGASPCIDAGTTLGTPTRDVDGEKRPQGSGVDMGADEYADTDKDGMPDYWERKYFGDLTHDGNFDSDSDGLSDAEELRLSTNPTNSDTDEDGYSDGVEAAAGTNPNDALSVPPVYVNAVAGDDANGGRTPQAPKKTIQAGINAAEDGETVIVAEGVYVENIRFDGKNIVLRSTEPPEPRIVANTIIDGNELSSGVTFSGTEKETCVLAGFTVRNGSAPVGGGICGGTPTNHTRATIHNNVISANSATWGGGVAYCDGIIQDNAVSQCRASSEGGGLYCCDGAIHDNTIADNYGGSLSRCGGPIYDNTITGNSGGLYDCDGLVRNNIITGNSAGYGGGLDHCDGMIEGNVISRNQAHWGGGGLHMCNGTIRDNEISHNSTTDWYGSGGGLDMCNGTIRNNKISHNCATGEFGTGGGLTCCTGTVENNIIAGNWGADRGGGLFECNGIVQNNTIVGNSAKEGGGLQWCHGTIVNCIIWANAAPVGAQAFESVPPTHCCIQGWSQSGNGNIAEDPRLVDPDGRDNNPGTYDDNDYHLRPDSPCIDAGTHDVSGPPDTDMDGESRLFGLEIDIGADEYVDADRDELPDYWEIDQFGTLWLSADDDPDADGLANREELARSTDPKDPDTDADGMSDGDEVFAWTDALDAQSLFRIIRVVQTPPGLAVMWSAVPLRTYQCYFSTDLEDVWYRLSGTVTAGPGDISLSAFDWRAVGAEKRYYKVSVLPP